MSWAAFVHDAGFLAMVLGAIGVIVAIGFWCGVLLASAPWQLSPRARDFLNDLSSAIRRSDHRMAKCAADTMRVRLPHLSRVLHPQEPNWLTRFADLGDEYERALIEQRAPKVGLVVIDERLAAALDLVESHRRRMLRMTDDESRTR